MIPFGSCLLYPSLLFPKMRKIHLKPRDCGRGYHKPRSGYPFCYIARFWILQMGTKIGRMRLVGQKDSTYC